MNGEQSSGQPPVEDLGQNAAAPTVSGTGTNCSGGGKRFNKGCSNYMYSCEMGHTSRDVGQELQQSSATIRQRDHSNRSALHYCSGAQRTTEAAATLAAAAPELLDSPDDDGLTPLHLAVIQGNLPLLNVLLAGQANVNALDNERHSVVHWATVCGEVQALRAVLAAGANISTPDIHGGSPLHYAAQMCGCSYVMACQHSSAAEAHEILDIILQHPAANVHVVDMDRRQPLLWAASSGSAKAILALVKAGAKVDSYDKDGLTAIHCAASRGHTECIDTLVNLCGSPTDLPDKNGCTALHYAVALGHIDCVALLLDLGANPNHQDVKGRTPAHCGCAKGQFETIRILKERAATDLWMRNGKGDQPIHDAASSGRRDLVEWLLLQKPGVVNEGSHDGRSLLHIAAEHNSTDMCKMLLDYGADVNGIYHTAKNIVMTPLDCSLTRSHRSAAKFLQSQGGLPASKLRISGRQVKAIKEHGAMVRPLSLAEEGGGRTKGRHGKKLAAGNAKKIVVYVNQSQSETDSSEDNALRDIDRKLEKILYSRRRRNKRDCSRRYARAKSFDIYLRQNSSSDEMQRSRSSIDVSKDVKKVGFKSECGSCREIAPTTSKDAAKPECSKTEQLAKQGEKITCAADIENDEPLTECEKTEIASKGDKQQPAAETDKAGDQIVDAEKKTPDSCTEKDAQLEENAREAAVKVTADDKCGSLKPIEEKSEIESDATYVADKSEMPNTPIIVVEAEPTDKLPDTNEDNKTATELLQPPTVKIDKVEPALQRNKEDTDKPASITDVEDSPQVSQNVEKGKDSDQPNPEIADKTIKDEDKPSLTAGESQAEEDAQLESPTSKTAPDASKDSLNQPTEEPPQRKSSFTVLEDSPKEQSDSELEDVPSFQIIKSYPNRATASSHPSSDDEQPRCFSAAAGAVTFSDQPPKSGGDAKRLEQEQSTETATDAAQQSNLDSGFEPSPRAGRAGATSIPSPRATSSVVKSKRVFHKRWSSSTRKDCQTAANKRAELNMTTVSMSLQKDIKRYYMERKIFQHLLELKSLQIRSSKANESSLVQRAVDDYHKSTLFARTDGDDSHLIRRYPFKEYTFKKFELHLYETLKSLQKYGSRNFQNISSVYNDTERRYAGSALHCTTKTHRCLHAAHAYTGIPCAAYIPMMNHHTMPKFGFGPQTPKRGGVSGGASGGSNSFCLPEILPLNVTGAATVTGTEARVTDGRTGVAVEVTHGNQRKAIYLPTNRLDRNKRYYVTLSVKDTNSESADL